MVIKFYSYFDLLCLVRILILPRKQRELYYFDISFPGKVALRLLKMDNNVKFFDFHLWQVKNKAGSSYCPRIYGKDSIAVCDAVENTVFNDKFFSSFMSVFNSESTKKGELFFRKDTGRKIKDLVVFINVVAWHCENIKKDGLAELSIEKCVAYEALKDLAQKKYGILLSSHFSFRKIFRYLYLLAGNIYVSTVFCFKTLFNVGKTDKEVKKARVSSLYTLRGLNFDLTARNDFPWLLLSDIDRKRVVVYFDRKDVPLTADMAQTLRSEGVQPLAVNKSATICDDVDVYKATTMVTKMISKFSAKSLILIVKELFKGNFIALLYLPEMIHFIRSYCQAYDFYTTNGIKVDVDFVDFDPYRVARRLALADSGGVSVSHQLSNWPVSNVTLGSSADAYFLFGPYYHKKLIDSGTRNESVVVSGFLTDYSFSRVKETSENLRAKLLSNGAKFVICYFDENSSDSRMSILPHSRSERVYRYFLNWVLEDRSIGLICSPKRPQTLTTRIPSITGLIQKAKDTGRCVFMDGEYAAHSYPTEAGQAADITISLLIGGTTSLEVFLSGKRVVYLDLEKFHSYPEYSKGKDCLVFDTLESLTVGINKYRKNREGFDEFGNINLAPGIQDKDPFRDGRAAERMGQYINWLINGFDQGKSRKQVMDYANNKYISAWGKERVSNGIS